MLFRSNKTYDKTEALHTNSFYDKCPDSIKACISKCNYVKIIVAYNKKLKCKIIEDDLTEITLPSLGLFKFFQILPEDNYARKKKPKVDYVKKTNYWLNQTDKDYHEIDDCMFYSSEPSIFQSWIKPVSFNFSAKCNARCFTLKFGRDIYRNINTKFNNKKLDLPVFNTR